MTRRERDGISVRWSVAYASGAFGLAVNSMVQFILPLRAAELGISLASIGVLLGVKGLVEAVSSVPVGGLIDRIGAKRAFTVGAATSAIIGCGFALTDSFVGLLVLQALLGAVRPLGWVGSQSYVTGLSSGEERSKHTGRFSSIATGAQITAPLLVGAVAQMASLTTAFFAFALYCGLFVLVGLGLSDYESRQSEADAGARPGFRSTLGLLRVKGIRMAMMLTFSRLWLVTAWTGFFPLLLVTAGVTEGVAGAVVSAMAVTATGISLLGGRLSRWFGSETRAAAVGLGVGSVGLAVAPILAGTPEALASAVLVGVGQGISLPMLIVIVSNSAPEGLRALALGLRGAVNQAAAALAPTAVAIVISFASPLVGFSSAAAIGLLLLAVPASQKKVEGPRQ